MARASEGCKKYASTKLEGGTNGKDPLHEIEQEKGNNMVGKDNSKIILPLDYLSSETEVSKFASLEF